MNEKKKKRKKECILKNTFEFVAFFVERSTSGAILCKYTNNTSKMNVYNRGDAKINIR